MKKTTRMISTRHADKFRTSRTQYHGAAKALAFHQDYAFVFEPKDGKAVIRNSKGDATAGH